ncbi:hypothetical protein E5161_02805 [Cohnella pontilimi]|uniref:Uncharacterized protein n=1 Tax=Cohnella pontilimi TaxID=2564100 RepID=A0A4U0FH43_9BACL|nr:hypothetical protein [Cohnella pontilimi]TJY44333.1 hypothetical protein E5161_02805 [Cohnella pontilimi]
MNLADMLCYADIDQLTRIAQAYQCSCSSHSKNELIQSILTAVQRRDNLESRVEEMSGDDLRFLNSLLFENRSAYSLEELKARAAGTTAKLTQESVTAPSPAMPAAPPAAPVKSGRSRKKRTPPSSAPASPEDEARQTISRFKRFGWLFNGFSHQTRYLYQVPDDMKRSLTEALERKFRIDLQERDEPPVYRDERVLLSMDLPVFLRYVRDHDVPLTGDGAMYKRQLGQVLDLMSVQEQIPGKGGWRFGYGRRFPDYPDRFSLLYDYAYYERLIRENPDRLIVTEEGLNAADGRPGIDPSSLYRFWLRLYKGPIPNLAALAQWISRLCTGWTTTASLFGILRPLIRSYYYDTEKDVLERRVLAMMLHLGLISWGESSFGEPVVRITPQGRAIISGNALLFEDKLQMDEQLPAYGG